MQQRALTIARLLRPFDVTNARKIRVGGDADGGYVMLDDFEGIETAFSLSVGPNVDWDYEVAQRGLPVHQFDHTVEGPPRKHDNFHFHRRMIVPTEMEDADTLTSMLDLAVTHRPQSSILKIDIENAELGVFAHATPEVLRKFSQVLCEFHAFEFFHLDHHYEIALQGLINLKKQFEVTHVHPNNSAGITYINDAPLPFVLEVTFASRSDTTRNPRERHIQRLSTCRITIRSQTMIWASLKSEFQTDPLPGSGTHTSVAERRLPYAKMLEINNVMKAPRI